MAFAALVFLVAQAAVEYPYWIAPCDPAETACKAGDLELARLALEAWQRSSDGAVTFVKAPSKDAALIRVIWASERMGLYGEARPIVVKGRRGAELYVRPEMEGLGEEIAAAAKKDPLFRDTVVYLTCLHESGHALGLGHTSLFEDIMYSFGFGGDILEYFMRYRRQLASRAGIAKVSGISPGDLRRLHALLAINKP